MPETKDTTEQLRRQALLEDLYAVLLAAPEDRWVVGLKSYRENGPCGTCYCAAGHAAADPGLNPDGLYIDKWSSTFCYGDEPGPSDLDDSANLWFKLFGAAGYSPFDHELYSPAHRVPGDTRDKAIALYRVRRVIGDRQKPALCRVLEDLFGPDVQEEGQ